MTPGDIDELFASQREAILALAFHMTGDRALAEDVLQETFLAAWTHRATFRGDARASTWLYRIALRRAARARAHRRARPVAPLLHEAEPTGAVGPREQAAGREERQRLYHGLDRLSEEHRAVLALLTLRGMTAAQVGEVLGIPANTVYSRAAAARRHLREVLEVTEPGTG